MVLLFFTTSSTTVLQAAYTPFGLPNVSFVGLAAYLIFFGLYHSALSIAHDVKLRQLVRDSLRKDSGFLMSIGDGQMMVELEGKILEITKKNSDTLEEKLAKSLACQMRRLKVMFIMFYKKSGQEKISLQDRSSVIISHCVMIRTIYKYQLLTWKSGISDISSLVSRIQ